MEFGTMNEYRPLTRRRRLGVPYHASRGDKQDSLVRAAAVLCVLAAAATAIALAVV